MIQKFHTNDKILLPADPEDLRQGTFEDPTTTPISRLDPLPASNPSVLICRVTGGVLASDYLEALL